MRLAVFTATLAATIFTTGMAFACSCAAPRSPEAMIGASDNIFRAQIVSATLNSTGFASTVTAIVNVLETFKGDASGAEVITTALQSATCGVPITLGAQTVYFASESNDGAYSVGLCSQLPYDSDRAAYEAALDALAPAAPSIMRFDRPIVIDRPVRIVPVPVPRE
jgi:hypothetical protein